MYPEEEDYEETLDDDYIEEEEHCCGECMDCLGLSWRDFL